jgi:hypothetical protein
MISRGVRARPDQKDARRALFVLRWGALAKSAVFGLITSSATFKVGGLSDAALPFGMREACEAPLFGGTRAENTEED